MRQSIRVSTQHSILLVGEATEPRRALASQLRAVGFLLFEAGNGAEALQLATSIRPEVVVTSQRLADLDVLALLPSMLALPEAPFVLVLALEESIDGALQAVQHGAESFLVEPVDPIALAACVRAACVRRQITLAQQKRAPQPAPHRTATTEATPYPWRSEAMLELEERIARVQSADCSVLLLGETGTGKSQLARRIHAGSARAGRDFVDFHAAGTSGERVEAELFGQESGTLGAHAGNPGLFELAEGGTLFFEELTDLEPAVQPKLLKVLEEKRFRRNGEARERSADVRVLAASRHDLLHEVAERKIRADLYHRIGTVTLALPPLRARHLDIVPFARHLLALQAPALRLEEAAEARLASHPWPGNLRELRNVVDRAVLLCRGAAITASEIVFDQGAPSSHRPSELEPSAAASSTVRPITLDQLEREHIARALDSERGHVESAARVLGIPRSTLYQKLKTYGIARRRSG